MNDLSGIIALAERAARFELLVEIYERETNALLEEIKMPKETIIKKIKDASKELGYLQMYLDKLADAIEKNENNSALAITVDNLDEYEFIAGNAFDAEIYGVKTKSLHSEVSEYLDEVRAVYED
jgi:hypothetical protein